MGCVHGNTIIDMNENQLRSRLKKWCIKKSSRREKWPNSLTYQNRADSNGKHSFVQSMPNEVLSTAKTVSAEQAGITASAPLPIDPRLSQPPSLPATSTSDGNDDTPPTYSSNTLYSTTNDFARAMQQVEAGQGHSSGSWLRYGG
ncbi:hypothetical protein BDV33DRAFT_209696 [Aspergillus novoparasiticus]|uniref:Clr5 domain-containing protein n=1 Tax=Aspergillus novoparasiticus TaxID=986946 RepID=A0A5N6E8P5_9EURO|nr:hypothetical protein BDV33DRAFT_209696 [Aspergillus novoparasiticus]